MLEGMFRYPVILRSFASENSAGVKFYKEPTHIMTYFYGDGELTLNGVSVSLSNKITVVTNSEMRIKENDALILPTQYDTIFKSESERDKKIKEPLANETWCIVRNKIYIYGSDGWTDKYVWECKEDGEYINTYTGRQDTVSGVAPYLKGMWDTKHRDMVIQSIKLK